MLDRWVANHVVFVSVTNKQEGTHEVKAKDFTPSTFHCGRIKLLTLGGASGGWCRHPC